MTQKRMKLVNGPVPSRRYDDGEICPQCNDRVLPIEACIDELGATWHQKCFVDFTVEYGYWLQKITPTPDDSFQKEDVVTGCSEGENRDHVNGVSSRQSYHIEHARSQLQQRNDREGLS